MLLALLFATVALVAGADSHIPPVPELAEEVPTYLRHHGAALAEAFVRNRGMGGANGDTLAMAKQVLGNIAEQPLERQRDYLAGMHDRLMAM